MKRRLSHDTDPDADLSDEDVAVLASPRRQLLIYHIGDATGEISLENAVRRVVASERQNRLDPMDDAAPDPAHDSLYRLHVPVLEAHGIIEYDDRKEVVRPTERLDELLEVIERSNEDRRGWFLRYLTPAAILTSLVAVHVFEVANVPDSVLTSLALGATVVSVLVASLHYTNTP